MPSFLGLYLSLLHCFSYKYRELAFQIADQFRVLGKPMGLKDCVVVGGVGKFYEKAILKTIIL